PERRATEELHGVRLRHAASLSATRECRRAADTRGGPGHSAHRTSRNPAAVAGVGGVVAAGQTVGAQHAAPPAPAALGALRGVGGTSLDHVTDTIRGARADEPQREIDDEANEREPQDRHRETEQAAENTEDELETEPCENSENREPQNAPEHDFLRGVRCVCSVRLNVAQSFVL